jgi:hypothetical protein
LIVYEHVRGREYQRDREEEGGILVRAIERILQALLKETSNKEFLLATHERLSKRIEELYGRGVAFNADVKSDQKSTEKGNSKMSA